MSSALDLLAGLVLEDGRRWGEVAHPFQTADAEAILDLDSARPYSFLTRSRGGSKTTDLAAVTIAAMVAQAPVGARLYAAAADRDQARLLLDAIGGFVSRTPGLGDVLTVGTWQATLAARDVTLDVLAADAAGSWGLRPWLLVVDELGQWPETPSALRLWDALSSGAAKLDSARMVVITTASSPTHWSRRVLDHAIADDVWHVHEVAGVAPWLDPVRVEEQRRRLLDSSFRRLFLNEWAAGEDALADPDDLRACVVLDGPVAPEAGRRYLIGVDLGLKADRTVAAVCHAEPLTRHEHAVGPYTTGTRIVLDRMQVWSGTREAPVRLQAVEEWLYEASRAYNAAPLRFDPWQALGSAQRLRARGVRCEEFVFSQSSVGRLGATLHLLIRNRLLALPDDEALIDELAAVRLRETSPGVVRLDHVRGQHDDRAVALSLAATTLLDRAPPGSGRLPSVEGRSSGLVEAVHGAAAWSLSDSGRFTEARYDGKF